MRWVATGLLVAMAVTFLVARALGDAAAGNGFVRAFAEAAMVGGLADWFAVTALFRHPLGLPIPHTAIIPRNKDRIGTTLAAFLRDNFLIPRVVAQRMHRVDVASAVGRWLAQRPRPDGPTAVRTVPLTTGAARGTDTLRRRRGDGRLRRGAWRLAVDLLGAFDPQRLGGMVKGAIGQRLRSLDLAPLLGQALHAAIADGRHLPLLDGTIRWAARILDANEHLVRRMVHDRAGSLLRWTGLDETLANKIIDGLSGMINDMADNPHHPLRAKAEEGLATLADNLLHDPLMQARVAVLKAEIIANPAMQRWLDGLWESARGGLLRVARDPDAAGRGQLGEALRQLGNTLLANPGLRVTINRFVRRTVVGFAADYGDGIVRLVSETVRGWDAGTITRRLENAVGRDLQYIRVNGTLVGGLVGVLIHAVDRWL